MPSMVVFLVVVWIADNLTWSGAAGMAFGVAQIGWQLIRRRPIEALQWLSCRKESSCGKRCVAIAWSTVHSVTV